MWIVIIFSLLAILLSYLESSGQSKNGMRWGFIFLGAIVALHYDYGNDYMAYFDAYKVIAQSSLYDVLNDNTMAYGETGWQLLNWLFSRLSVKNGFFLMVALIALLQNYFCYQFIRREVPQTYWTFAVFVYVCNTSLYLLSFSMMRQSFVIFTFMAIWPLIRDRKWIPSLIILVGCSFIHRSSLILLPFAFWGFLPVKNGKLLGGFYAALFVALFVSKDLLNSIYQNVMLIEQFDEYATTYDAGGVERTFSIGRLLSYVPFVAIILYLILNKEADENLRRMVALAGIGAFVVPFSFIIPLLGRVGMYFMVYQIAALPLAFGSIKQPYRNMFFMVYFVISIYGLYQFFEPSSAYSVSYSTYHTIFSVL